MSGATVVLVLATLAIAAMAGPLFDYCRADGEQLVDASTYVRAVVGP